MVNNMHLSTSSLSVCFHRFSQEGSDNRGERLPVCLVCLLFSFPSVICIDLLCLTSDWLMHNICSITSIFTLPISFLVADAVPIWSGPSPWEKDWPQEGRCLWRDDIQEGKTFIFTCLLFVCSSRLHQLLSTYTLVCLFFSLFSTSRRPLLPWKGPSSWVLDILLVTSAPSLRGMCWCRTSMWSKAFFSPGVCVCVWAYVCGKYFI